MKERIIALSSLAAGLAALGLVAVIQVDPLSFTRGAPAVLVMDPPLSIPAHGIAVAWSLPAAALQAPAAVELPPVYIHSTASTSPTEQQRPLEPCSVWRELGPKYVTDGVPGGTHWVRDLC